MLARPQADLELQPVAAPAWASKGARVYTLLPSVSTLVGKANFGEPAIRLTPARPAFDPWAFFHSVSIH